MTVDRAIIPTVGAFLKALFVCLVQLLAVLHILSRLGMAGVLIGGFPVPLSTPWPGLVRTRQLIITLVCSSNDSYLGSWSLVLWPNFVYLSKSTMGYFGQGWMLLGD